MSKHERVHCPYIACLEIPISVHLLPRQQLFLSVHAWSPEEICKDMAKLYLQPVCQVVTEILGVASFCCCLNTLVVARRHRTTRGFAIEWA